MGSILRILTIDGGGVRGVLPLRILLRLEDELRRAIEEETDVYAGTSTGGIIALALAHGMSVLQVEQLYRELAAEVFPRTKGGGIVWGASHRVDLLIRALDRSEPFKSNKPLRALDKGVVVTTFAVDGSEGYADPPGAASGRWRPLTLSNLPGSETSHWGARDAALATSAAPTFFPSFPKEIGGRPRHFVDGGVFANNPTMVAIAEAFRSRRARDLVDLRVLSLTTGRPPTLETSSLDGAPHNWGGIRWLREGLVNLMLDATVVGPREQAEALLGRTRFHRVETTLTQEVALDDAKALPELGRAAEAVNLVELKKFLRERYLFKAAGETKAVFGRRLRIVVMIGADEVVRSLYHYMDFVGHGERRITFETRVPGGCQDQAQRPRITLHPIVLPTDSRVVGQFNTGSDETVDGYMELPATGAVSFSVESATQFNIPRTQTAFRERFPGHPGPVNEDAHEVTFSSHIERVEVQLILPQGHPFVGFGATLSRPDRATDPNEPSFRCWANEVVAEADDVTPGTELKISWKIPQ